MRLFVIKQYLWSSKKMYVNGNEIDSRPIIGIIRTCTMERLQYLRDNLKARHS